MNIIHLCFLIHWPGIIRPGSVNAHKATRLLQKFLSKTREGDTNHAHYSHPRHLYYCDTSLQVTISDKQTAPRGFHPGAVLL